jgi:glucose-1-phosphate thymidylyltransferase
MLKGIVLAGGTGSRLWPITKSLNKHLIPIFDKPMIFYPISTLMLIGIKEILLITRPEDQFQFKNLLGDGSQWGISITFELQKKPQGIAQALLIGQDFIGQHDFVLALGDNIFYGNGFQDKTSIARSNLLNGKSSILSYRVEDASRYGVVEFDKKFNVLSIEEKPIRPKSNFAVTGLYFYTNDVIKHASELKPSSRGELEISDLNSNLIKNEKLKLIQLGRGFAWLDTGTYTSLIDAAMFISTIEKRQGYKISVPEEVAYRMGFINEKQLIELGKSYANSYGDYLLRILEDSNET